MYLAHVTGYSALQAQYGRLQYKYNTNKSQMQAKMSNKCQDCRKCQVSVKCYGQYLTECGQICA